MAGLLAGWLVGHEFLIAGIALFAGATMLVVCLAVAVARRRERDEARAKLEEIKAGRAKGLETKGLEVEGIAVKRTKLQRMAGFTLVELLVVVTIIGMLAGLVLFALGRVREKTREEQTRATVLKLDTIVRKLYDEYRTRRVALIRPASDPQARVPAVVAADKLAVLRDTMRLEMPERLSDVLDPKTGNPRGSLFGLSPSSLPMFYVRRMAGKTFSGNSSAECLYLIVAAAGEDARKQFTDSEVADTDSNGLMEFIDGWGKPIQFLRWAPGFNESDVQANISSDADAVQACSSDHDPFDNRKVDVARTSTDYPRGWRLVPLIYSAGPDGEYGLAIDYDQGTNKVYTWGLNSTSEHYQAMWGRPDDSEGHYDNITNHRVETP